MLRTQHLPIILLIGALFVKSPFVASKNDHAEEWCYNGKCGPKTWKGKCRFGGAQSPIDIRPAQTKRSQEGRKLKLSKAYYEPQSFEIENNGHTVQLHLGGKTNGSGLEVEGAGWKGKYNFVQMHFHWGSEHTFKGLSPVS
jgi:carbonic anhydrase